MLNQAIKQEESLEERQENEVEALKAIYDKDFEDLRLRDVWKVRRPPEFVLKLSPQANYDSESGNKPVACKLDLHIKCSTNYPLSPPSKIEPINSEGLSEEHLKELKTKVRVLAKDLTGNEMVMEIAQNVSTWLAAHNKALLEKKNPFCSFYEEMEARNKAEIEEKELELRRKRQLDDKIENEKRAAILEEIAETAEALKEEKQRRKEKRSSSGHGTDRSLSRNREPGVARSDDLLPSSFSSGDGKNAEASARNFGSVTQRTRYRSMNSVSDYSENESVENYNSNDLSKDQPPWKGMEKIHFFSKGEKIIVEKYSSIGQNVLGGRAYAGTLVSSGKLVVISEWIFPLQTSYSTGDTKDIFEKRVKSKKVAFTDETKHDETVLIKQLTSIEQEMNSVQKLSHPNLVPYLGMSSEKCGGKNGIKVFIVEEFIRGTNLSFYLKKSLPIDPPTLRHYTISILEVLNYMHTQNIVHRDLKDTSVYIESGGIVRVGDFSIDKRIREVVCSKLKEEDSKFPLAIGRGGKKTDVYRFGILLLSLSLGEIVKDPSVPKKGLPEQFIDFINKCLLKDERERWTAAQLLDHDWIKTPLAHFHGYVGQATSRQHNEDNETESISPEPNDEGLEEKAIPFPLIGSGQSRLQCEFNYIGPIGKGGFGEVMKVKKLLDGRVYAIKRIQLNPKNQKLTKKIVREVKLLSRLDHENVVRYYNSWVEVMETTETALKKSFSDDDDEDYEDEEDELDVANSSDRPHPSIQRQTSDPKQVTFSELPQKRLFDHFLRPNHSSSPVPPLMSNATNEASNSEWSFSHYVPDTDSEKGDEDDDSESDELDGRDFGDEDNDDMFGTSFLPLENDAWNVSAEEEEDSIVFQDSNDEEGQEDLESQSSPRGKNYQPPTKPTSLSSSSEKVESDSACKTSSSTNMGRKQELSAEENEVDATVSNQETRMQLQFLYIQMEYCDKQTLRSAIDEGNLFKDSKRLWRMFREIIEGLLHIHSQAMIHRDLKPVNLFIHSNGQLKIGDFGLATTNMITKGGSHQIEEPTSELFNNTQSAGDTLDTSDLTGHVGTAMYVAPEINSGKSTTSYNQKVDIYSLGIIFFEMCYPPLQTGMERIKILSNLRCKDILLPPEGKEGLILNDTQINIIRWLLNHDPSKRPTSHELLTSDHLPPLQVEEAKAQEMIRQTLNDKKGKMHRYLVNSCLNQDMTIGQDIKYDMDLSKNLAQRRHLLGREYVRGVVKKVFQRHGAVFIQSPQLLPKGNLRVYEWTPFLVKTMSRSGSVVSLPFDLRVPFARYVARTHIQSIRRYCIAPVFREARVYDVQPKELIECAFDIITPSKESLIADAEIMIVAQQILRELNAPEDASRCYLFRLNHMALFRGILLHFGIEEVHHINVSRLIKDRDNWLTQQRTEQLVKCAHISEQAASSLLSMLERERSLSQLSSVLRQASRRKNQAAHDIKHGLHELEIIIENAQTLGLELDVKVSPCLVHHPDLFDGMVCQLVKRKKVKGQTSETIIAAGGRYDSLIKEFSEKFTIADSAVLRYNSGSNVDNSTSNIENPTTPKSNHSCHSLEQYGVGISFMLHHLVDKVSSFSAVASRDTNTSLNVAAADVLIYAPSTLRELNSVTKRILEVTSSLWNANIRCFVCDTHDSIDEAQDVAQDLGASFLVILHDDEGIMRVRCLKEKDPSGHTFIDIEKVSTLGLIEVLQRRFACYEKESVVASSILRMESKSLDFGPNNLGNVTSQSSPNTIFFNFKFLDFDKRQLSTVRKRLELNVTTKISKLTHSTKNSSVVVLMLPFKASVIKSIASYLEIEDEARFQDSVKQLMERQQAKEHQDSSERSYKKELTKVCDEIEELRFDKDYSIIILYGNFVSTDGKKTDRPKFLTPDEHVFRIIT